MSMRDIINKVLTEAPSSHPVAAHFAPLDAALTAFENGRAIVEETLHTYMKVEAFNLSKTGSLVIISGGMGSLSIEVYPGREEAERLSRLLDDPETEDEAYEWQGYVNALNDPTSRAPFMPFKVNDKIAHDYGVDAWNLGEFAYQNGAEVPMETARAYVKDLHPLLQQFGRG